MTHQSTKQSFRICTSLLASVAFIPLAASVNAQALGIGTTQGGATGQIGTALAQVISTNSDLQVIPQVSANTSQYIVLLNQGKVELGIANYPQTYFAMTGTGMSSEPAENLRLVATMMPFKAALLATEDSGIASYADIKGHTVPRYPEKSLGDFVVQAALASGGLTYDDVTSVPIANFPQQYQAFKDGRIDVTIGAVGSQATFELEASRGDIQFLPVSADTLSAAQEFLPGSYIADIEASEDIPGLDAATSVFAYDYLLFANADVPDEQITKIVSAIYEGVEFLKGTSPLWAEFDPVKMGKMADIPYHPGAIAFYKEKGLID